MAPSSSLDCGTCRSIVQIQNYCNTRLHECSTSQWDLWTFSWIVWDWLLMGLDGVLVPSPRAVSVLLQGSGTERLYKEIFAEVPSRIPWALGWEEEAQYPILKRLPHAITETESWRTQWQSHETSEINLRGTALFGCVAFCCPAIPYVDYNRKLKFLIFPSLSLVWCKTSYSWSLWALLSQIRSQILCHCHLSEAGLLCVCACVCAHAHGLIREIRAGQESRLRVSSCCTSRQHLIHRIAYFCHLLPYVRPCWVSKSYHFISFRAQCQNVPSQPWAPTKGRGGPDQSCPI